MKKITKSLIAIAMIGAAFVAQPLIAGMSMESKVSTRAGDAITPPYMSDFETDEWTIINVESKSETWKTGMAWSGLRITYDFNYVKDDWAITPGLYLESGKIYTVSYKVKCSSASDPEKIEVKYGQGNDIDSMTQELMSEQTITSTSFISFNKEIIPSETGIYYIGFHATSEANKYNLDLNEVTVSAGLSGDAPGEITNLVLTPDPTGALKCNISFTTPDKNFTGGALTSLTEVEILRGEESVKTFTNPAMGQTLSFEDSPSTGGNITYTVVAKNESGNGNPISATTFVGFDKPEGVSSATLTRDDMEGNGTIIWEPVTKDINGLSLTENDVKYKIRKIDGFSLTGPVMGEVIVDELKGNSYSGKLIENGEQEFLQVAVIPYTSGGEGGYKETERIVIGTPYQRYAESFPGFKKTKAIDFSVEKSSSYSSSEVGVISYIYSGYNPPKDGQDGDGGFVTYYLNYTNEKGYITTGLISDEIVNPTLSFYIYKNGENNTSNLSVRLKPISAVEWITIYEPIAINELLTDSDLNSWKKVSIQISDSNINEPYQVQIQVASENNSSMYYTFIDNIVLESVLADDLTVTDISAPSNVTAGQNYKVTATIFNRGSNDATEYTVLLFTDDELADSKTMTALAVEEAATVSFDVAMSSLAVEPVTHYVKVVYQKDMDTSNDTSSTIEVTPEVSTLPTVDNLNGDDTGESILLIWSAPDLESMATSRLTEGFEDGEVGSPEYDGWTFVDNDGKTLSFYKTVPGIESGVTKGSFFILDSAECSWATQEPYTVHQGSKCIFAPKITYGYTTDDWAISPELSGEAQTVTFWARSATDYDYMDSYLSQIEVYYSETSTDPSDFEPIQNSLVTSVPSSWTEYSVELPEGAKYFAIRSYGKNADLLYIDDVTYTPLNPASFEIIGYNVYRNGEKLNDQPVEDTNFTDENAPEGENVYHVTVVYKDLGESAPTKLTMTFSATNSFETDACSVLSSNGNLIILNGTGINITVVSLDGQIIFNGEGSDRLTVPVAKGVYIVKAGDVVKKVLVK